jgi:hypothetical protein
MALQEAEESLEKELARPASKPMSEADQRELICFRALNILKKQ